jgi:hypothetical protein
MQSASHAPIGLAYATLGDSADDASKSDMHRHHLDTPPDCSRLHPIASDKFCLSKSCDPEDDQDSESVTAEPHDMPMTPCPIPVFFAPG